MSDSSAIDRDLERLSALIYWLSGTVAVDVFHATFAGAAAAGDLPAVERFLAAGHTADGGGEDRRTPIEAAASQGHLAVVKRLLAAGAGLASRRPTGGGPLVAAAENGHTAIVDFLLDHGATDQPFVGSPVIDGALSAAIARGHVEASGALSEWLLEDRSGVITCADLPLVSSHAADAFVDNRIALEAVTRIADRNRQRLRHRHRMAARTSAKRPRAQPLTDDASAAFLDEACALIASDRLRGHLDRAVGPTGPALVKAARLGIEALIDPLLMAGADPSVTDKAGDQPIHAAACSINRVHARGIVRRLLAGGGAVNVVDDTGHTALARATERGDLDMVRLLLEHGADPWSVGAGERAAAALACGVDADEIRATLWRQALENPIDRRWLCFEDDPEVDTTVGPLVWTQLLHEERNLILLARGPLDAFARRCQRLLGWSATALGETAPPPVFRRGVFLVSFTDSQWVFGFPWPAFSGIPVASDTQAMLQCALAREHEAYVVDTYAEYDYIAVERLARGQCVERVVQNDGAGTILFESELRPRPSWADRPDASLGPLFTDEIEVGFPAAFVKDDGTAPRLVVDARVCNAVTGAVCLFEAFGSGQPSTLT